MSPKSAVTEPEYTLTVMQWPFDITLTVDRSIDVIELEMPIHFFTIFFGPLIIIIDHYH